jgi:hypothetical protein
MRCTRIASFAAVFLLAALLGIASPVLGRQAIEQPSGPGGLGNTRTDLNRVHGAVDRTNLSDHGDYAVESVSYEDAWVFFLVADGTTPSPDDRAIIIHQYPDMDQAYNFTYQEAIAIANQLLPSDVIPTSDLLPRELPPPFDGKPIDHRQSFYSESIARLFPDPDLYGDGEPGTVWLVLTLDYGVANPGNHFVRVEVRLDEP